MEDTIEGRVSEIHRWHALFTTRRYVRSVSERDGERVESIIMPMRGKDSIFRSIFRCIEWLYSTQNPQIDTYFRDLRKFEEKEEPEDFDDSFYYKTSMQVGPRMPIKRTGVSP